MTRDRNGTPKQYLSGHINADIDGSIRTIKTTKATAVYYYPDDDDADNDEGCQWIFDDLYSDYVLDVPIRTQDVSGLDPCN